MKNNSDNTSSSSSSSLADDLFYKLIENRILFLPSEISSDNATELVATLLLLDGDSNEPVTLYINSYGGDLTGLMAIYDVFQCIKSPIKTICIGEAYSAAAVLLASGTKGMRAAYPNARIMIHSIQISDLSGSQSEINKENKRIQQDNNAMLEILARYSGQTLRKIRNDCKSDKFFTANEALKYGLIDEVISYTKDIPALRRK